jgi:uncharacterized protein (DUF58 family)
VSAHLTAVRRSVSIHAHRKALGLLDGEYAAVTTGRSMDFNDLREYVVGDDVKDIDWKATSRSLHPLVKRYVAVRRHTVLLVVSTGRSMSAMNDLSVTKRELAVLTAGVIGSLAVGHGDHVQLVHGDVAAQHTLPAESGEVHLERLLTRIDDAIGANAARSDLASVLRQAIRTVRRRTIAVVIADEPEVDEPARALLARLAAQHEVLFVTISDHDATTVLDRAVVDVETGRAVSAWARGDEQVRAEVSAAVAEADARTRQTLDRLGIVGERVHDHPSAVAAIFRLLRRHRHARRR